MKEKKNQWLRFGGLLWLCLFSCGKEDETGAKNMPPTSDLAISYAIAVPKDNVLLVGSAADSDGHIASYRWSKVFGPSSYRFADSTKQSTGVDRLVKGSYKFEFRATDDDGASVVKIVTVDVLDALRCPCEPHCDDVGDPCNPWDY